MLLLSYEIMIVLEVLQIHLTTYIILISSGIWICSKLKNSNQKLGKDWSSCGSCLGSHCNWTYSKNKKMFKCFRSQTDNRSRNIKLIQISPIIWFITAVVGWTTIHEYFVRYTPSTHRNCRFEREFSANCIWFCWKTPLIPFSNFVFQLDMTPPHYVLPVRQFLTGRFHELMEKRGTSEWSARSTDIFCGAIQRWKWMYFPNHCKTCSNELYTSVSLLFPKCFTMLENIFSNVSTTVGRLMEGIELSIIW